MQMEFYWSIYFGVAFIIFATNSKHLPFGLEWTECQISSHRDVQRCLLRFEIGCLIRQTTEKLPFSFRINHKCSTFTDIYSCLCVFATREFSNANRVKIYLGLYDLKRFLWAKIDKHLLWLLFWEWKYFWTKGNENLGVNRFDENESLAHQSKKIAQNRPH